MTFAEIQDAVIAMAQKDTSLPIVSGALLVNDSISLTYSYGAPIETFRTRADNYRMGVTLNGKSLDQRLILDELTKIHKHLTRAYNYPSSDEWQVYAIETEAPPTYLGRQDDGHWLYGSSLNIKFYWRNLNAE